MSLVKIIYRLLYKMVTIEVGNSLLVNYKNKKRRNKPSLKVYEMLF